MQADERVEHARASTAAHVSLAGAQIGSRDDECQRALGTDREHARMIAQGDARRTKGRGLCATRAAGRGRRAASCELRAARAGERLPSLPFAAGAQVDPWPVGGCYVYGL